MPAPVQAILLSSITPSCFISPSLCGDVHANPSQAGISFIPSLVDLAYRLPCSCKSSPYQLVGQRQGIWFSFHACLEDILAKVWNDMHAVFLQCGKCLYDSICKCSCCFSVFHGCSDRKNSTMTVTTGSSGYRHKRLSLLKPMHSHCKGKDWNMGGCRILGVGMI